MASHGLRDQDRLESVSNFVIWRARILSVLDEYGIKDHATSVLAVLADADPLKKFKENQAWTKRLIMDGVKDRIVPHIAEKNTANDMWVALEAMYKEASSNRKCS